MEKENLAKISFLAL